MRQEVVQYFTDKEEEFVNLLIKIGTKRKVAKVLVFLASTKEATARAIESGADIRQPDVSMAMKYLMEQGWIKIKRESPSQRKGQPVKVYELAKPIDEIINCIESETKNETRNKLAIVKKIRKYID